MKQTLLALILGSLVVFGLGTQEAASQVDAKSLFAEVDKLANEEKLQAALDKLLEGAKASANQADDYLRAEFLIRAAKLRAGLHGYETAVRELKAAEWPKRPEGRILVELYYAHSLMAYYQMYSWEIRGREKTVSQDKVDLKAWTTEQIGSEIGKSFDSILSSSENQKILDKAPPAIYGEHFSKNSYPAGVRPTLRDAVTYFAVEHLRNSQYWSPDQSANSYLVKLDKTTEGFTKRIAAADEKVHPLVRVASWLGELREFHIQSGQLEAAMESRYVLYDVFHSAQAEALDRSLVRQRLRSFQERNQNQPWWSRGQALLADMTLQSGESGARVEAREIALSGYQKHPKSFGGKTCEAIIYEVERPDYRITAMGVDHQSAKSARNSILVNYKNLKRIYFRAYKLSLEQAFRRQFNGVDPILSYEYLESLRRGTEKWVAEWDVALESTPDFSYHRKLVAPKLPGPGAYVIESSSRADFSISDNVVLHVRHMNTNLVLSVVGSTPKGLESRVQFGDSGTPASQVDVSLYRYSWNKAPVLVETKKSDAQGYVSFVEPQSSKFGGSNYFLYARKDSHESYLMQGVYFREPPHTHRHNEALVYTDRSIYRPNQKVFYKAVAYSGDPNKAGYQTAKAGEAITVQLRDPNYQVVATKALMTNQFGTASGEFLIPSGRPLGGWTVEVLGGYSGRSQIRVEEYKRPTFETSITDSLTPLRLNKPATIKGEAKYYFGLPVSSGTVKWRVLRSPRAPLWWSYYGWSWWFPPAPPQTVATGESAIRSDGTFEVAFTPTADERLSSDPKRAKDLSYSFSIEANVTDEGGETRTGEKTFRIGFQNLEAQIETQKRYSLATEKIDVDVRVANLSGAPKAVSGRYTLHRLRQPAEAPLPADLPREARQFADRDPLADEKLKKHADDDVRSRWETDARWEAIAAGWPDGEVVASGPVKTNAEGVAKLSLDAVNETGVYKVTFDCKDEFGNAVSVSRHILVAEAQKPKLQFPLLLLADKSSYEVGETAKVLVFSGLKSQRLTFEVFRAGERLKREEIVVGQGLVVLSLPISKADRGGLTVTVAGLRDHQAMEQEINLTVPWTDRELEVKYTTFRDQIRPGSKETFRITVADKKNKPVGKGEAEILAYMYDRSLDLFGPHQYQTVSSLYPTRFGAVSPNWSLNTSYGQTSRGGFESKSRPFPPTADALGFYANYGVGGPGMRGRGRYFRGASKAMMNESFDMAPAAPMSSARSEMREEPSMAATGSLAKAKESKLAQASDAPSGGAAGAGKDASVQIRSEFSETAFFYPHLVTDANGAVGFEFQVPDSVTSWQVYAHALTKDLRGGTTSRETKSVKELMVRTYAPRFLREGDEAEIKVSVNNAGQVPLSGELTFDIENPLTGKSALRDFGLQPKDVKRAFRVDKQGTTTLTFSIKTPRNVGQYAFMAIATAKQKGTVFSDGERKPFPVLPSWMHLAQSRFVTLKNKSSKVLAFDDLAKGNDPTLINEKMVVTVDAQLFYGVLRALPYLVKYPYECTEQTLNRFLSTGIVTSLFKKYPSIQKMASEMSKRKERLERFDDIDANRRMTLEESPWLQEAKGGQNREEDDLINVLDSRVATAERESALLKLRKMQLPSGGFPWFQGGPADKYMTLYILMGFGRALEFQVDVPKDVVRKAWAYVRTWLTSDLEQMMRDDCCHELITLLNFAVSQYPDPSWSGGLFDEAYRKQLLDYSFGKWKNHSPLLKGYLALTLKRLNREQDAKLVWDSVMDSAKSNDEQGTFWAQEDRSWLWYNDTIETHAFSIRALLELEPKNDKLDGLVQWLFLNKKLNHWKSTKATAESIYSLAHFLDKTAALGVREDVQVDLGTQKTSFVFEPDKYTGRKNQIVIEGDKVSAKHHSKIQVSKTTPGFAFASAVWHFSTDELPKEDRGDFFQISRKYFKRENNGKEWILKPLHEGEQVRIGDQIEVQISIRLKHAAEYVHLRDPRAAGLEPESVRSGYRYDLGVSWFEETRDSGTNFFFSRLPVGEYTFRYRLRANMGGHFRIGPATIQSIYAPEFNAYSSGAKMKVFGAGKP